MNDSTPTTHDSVTASRHDSTGGVRALPGLLAPDSVLHRKAGDLTARFAGMVSAETVERLVFESYTALRRTATVDAHLPVLAGRFAEDRLTALAQAKGTLPKDGPQVLFVCVHNAGRSQLAAALMSELSGGRVHVRSAGSQPAASLDPAVAQVISELGAAVDAGAGAAEEALPSAFPKPLTDDVVQAADVVITMGCGDACPIYPGKRYEDWDVADPFDQNVDAVRAIGKDIEVHVRRLLSELLPDSPSDTTPEPTPEPSVEPQTGPHSGSNH